MLGVKTLYRSNSRSIESSGRATVLLLFTISAFLPMAGCARKKPLTADELIEQAKQQSAAVAALSKPKSVELLAEAVNNYVAVTVINHTDKPVIVGPKFFAVLVDGRPYPADAPEVLAQFPVRTLKGQEGVSGSFQFRNLTSVEGQKLVFKSPDTEAQFVVINRRQQRASVYQPPASSSNAQRTPALSRDEERAMKQLRDELEKQKKSVAPRK